MNITINHSLCLSLFLVTWYQNKVFVLQGCDDTKFYLVSYCYRVVKKKRDLLDTSSNPEYVIFAIFSSHTTSRKLMGKVEYLKCKKVVQMFLSERIKTVTCLIIFKIRWSRKEGVGSWWRPDQCVVKFHRGYVMDLGTGLDLVKKIWVYF